MVDAREGHDRVFGEDGDWAATYRPADRARRVGETVRLPALERLAPGFAPRSAQQLAQPSAPAPTEGCADRQSVV